MLVKIKLNVVMVYGMHQTGKTGTVSIDIE